MRQSILRKQTLLKETIDNILNILKCDESQLSTLLSIPLEELEFAKTLLYDYSFDAKRPERDNKLYELITTIDSYLHRFKKHFMTAEDCLISLTHTFEFEYEDKNKKSFKATLVDLAKGEFGDRWGTGSGTVDRVCLMFFKKYTIGENGDAKTLLNKKISEEFFNRKVDVQEVTRYSEGGDYTELKVQERIEIYDDGSGENWENLKNYCTDMGEAWKLVEKLAEQGVQVRFSNKAMHNDYWWCYLSSRPEDTHPDVTVQASSAPEAICLAVLEYLAKKKAFEALSQTK